MIASFLTIWRGVLSITFFQVSGNLSRFPMYLCMILIHMCLPWFRKWHISLLVSLNLVKLWLSNSYKMLLTILWNLKQNSSNVDEHFMFLLFFAVWFSDFILPLVTTMIVILKCYERMMQIINFNVQRTYSIPVIGYC